MKSIKVLDRVLEIATILTFISIIVVVTIQILSRYLPYTAVWTEELTRFLFIYAISLAAPLALKHKEFIRVDLLVDLLPEKVKGFYEVIIYSVLLIVNLIIAYHGYTFMAIGKGQRSATMGFDMSIMHASIGISVLLISIYALLHVISHVKSLGERGDR